MKKKKGIGIIVFAVLLVLAGIVISVVTLASKDFDFMSFSTVSKPETFNKTFDINEVDKIYIEAHTGDITFLVSEDNDVHIEYTGNENYSYEVKKENNQISIIKDSSVKNWLNYLQFNLYGFYDKVKVAVPTTYLNEIEINVTTGEVELNSIVINEKIKIKASTGDIHLDSCTCSDLQVNYTTGRIYLDNVNVTTNVDIHGTTGDVKAKNIVCDKVIIAVTTGQIKFSSIEANNLELSATTGEIEGTFDDAVSNYTITSSTKVGDKNIPSSTTGSKLLNVKTTVGDIEISFAE